MTSIGDTLRRERLRRGWDLNKVSAETKISVHLLEAIEGDEIQRLPGGVFAKSFVRQYAHLLGLDEEELAAEAGQQFEPPEPASPIEAQRPAPHLLRLPALDDFRDRVRSDSTISALAWVVIVMLACAGIYSLWQRPRKVAKVETVAPVAAAQAQPAAPVAQTASTNKPVAPVADPPKSEFRAAEISDTGIIQVPPAAAYSQTQTTPGQITPAATEAARVRVVFTASQPVWVSIKADGSHVFSGTLEGNQAKQVDADKKVSVLLGNAGGVKITLNGKPVGSLGANGEIKQLVLTPQGVQVVPRTPPTPPPTPGDSAARTEAAVRP